MSVSKYRYTVSCDGQPCPGDCDLCGKEESNVSNTLDALDALDLISRKAVFDAIWEIFCNRALDSDRWVLADVREKIEQLPSAQPDIIRCRDCIFWREHKYAKETKRYIPFCGFNAIYTKADDFCSRAERRTDG